MQFKDYVYARPNYERLEKVFQENIKQLRVATTVADAMVPVQVIQKEQRTIDTMMNLAAIRHSIDTTNDFYEKEDEFWNEYMPKFEHLNDLYYSAILESELQEELWEQFPRTFILLIQNSRRCFDETIIPLLQQENQLISEYEKLIASAQIEFQGEKRTLPQMTPFAQDINQSVRKEAAEKVTGFFEEHEAQFDRIYDDLVKVRTQMAKELGFKNFTEMSYARMNRLDYDQEMVADYRRRILEEVVPVAQKLYQRQAGRLGLEKLHYYDLPIEFLSGNATPQGTYEELLDHAQKMYHELSPETGTFFDFMRNHDLLDLKSKKGKQSGGYCTMILDYDSPFIFANFNGTSGDVDVLTHEAGHAFQVFESMSIKEPEIVFPTYESCEIHSMSMEFITWPWMDGFFKDETTKYKFSHLSQALMFLPYGVLVDHYQHEVYDHPEFTPDERKAIWRKLEKQYLPHKNYEDSPALERGLFWMRQGHIFASPFYYIDYTLAQVCAFQFWKRFQVDQDPKAWEDYLAICQVGGTKSFLEIVKLAHLQSPFAEGTLKEVMTAIDAYLGNISDDELK